MFGIRSLSNRVESLSQQLTEQQKQLTQEAEVLETRINEQNELKAFGKDLASMVTAVSAQIFPSWQVFKDIETYRIVDEISSVVNKLAKTAASLPVYAYQPDGQDLPDGTTLTKILKNFSYSERLKLFSFLYLSDEVFIYKQKVEFGPNAGMMDLHILHPNFMIVVLSMDFPTKIVGYIYRDPQVNYECKFLPEEILFIRGWNPEIDFYTRWRGLSKIQLLSRRITRLEANKANSTGQLQNGGVPGILVDKHQDFDVTAKGKRDTDMLRFFTNSANKGLPYTTGGDPVYIQIGSTLVDMNSTELALIDSKGIYNAYAISGEWMNVDSTVRSDVKEMIRQVYTTAIQPYTKLVEEAFEKDVDLGGGPNVTIAFDFSSVPELQSTKKDQMDAFAAAPCIRPNDVLEALGGDRDPDPKMNMPWFKSTYQPLDSFDEVPPVDDPLQV